MNRKSRKTLTPAALCVSIAAHALAAAALCFFAKRFSAPEAEHENLVEFEVAAGRTDAETEDSAESENAGTDADAPGPEAARRDPEPEIPDEKPESPRNTETEAAAAEPPREDAGEETPEPESGENAPETAAAPETEAAATSESAANDGGSAAPKIRKSTLDIAYPRRARRRGEEGDVTAELEINADGTVASARVLKSSGSADLDAAALAALKRAAFEPAVRGGKPVSGTIAETVEFRLR